MSGPGRLGPYTAKQLANHERLRQMNYARAGTGKAPAKKKANGARKQPRLALMGPPPPLPPRDAPLLAILGPAPPLPPRPKAPRKKREKSEIGIIKKALKDEISAKMREVKASVEVTKALRRELAQLRADRKFGLS